jgi:hypothetical protein
MAVTPRNNTATNNAPAVRAAQRPSRGSNSGAGQDWEKADAFINIALPTEHGNRVRLDAVKLYMSNPVHAQIITKMTAPELTVEDKLAKLEALKQLMVLEFNLPLTDEQKVLVDF